MQPEAVGRVGADGAGADPAVGAGVVAAGSRPGRRSSGARRRARARRPTGSASLRCRREPPAPIRPRWGGGCRSTRRTRRRRASSRGRRGGLRGPRCRCAVPRGGASRRPRPPATTGSRRRRASGGSRRAGARRTRRRSRSPRRWSGGRWRRRTSANRSLVTACTAMRNAGSVDRVGRALTVVRVAGWVVGAHGERARGDVGHGDRDRRTCTAIAESRALARSCLRRGRARSSCSHRQCAGLAGASESPDAGDAACLGPVLCSGRQLLERRTAMDTARDGHARSILPIPDVRPPGLTTYDAKDPATSFPPIEPLRPPAGAPNVLVVLLDDVGFGASSAFGGPVPHADGRAPRRRRSALQPVPHDGAVRADAPGAADRSQPPLRRHGQHHRDGDLGARARARCDRTRWRRSPRR